MEEKGGSTLALHVDPEVADEIVDDEGWEIVGEQAEVDPSSLRCESGPVRVDGVPTGGQAHSQWTPVVREHSHARGGQGSNPVLGGTPERLARLPMEEVGQGAHGTVSLSVRHDEVHQGS
ncbi:hypothetical protein ACICHK_41180 (plasmid) [Streptomyces sp. AHU1]|uniref:hypothetical protein n=1 Tax=Streptomyces sp. AHU1 TaxID=3377215 RepID=UPI003877ABF9